MNPALPPASSAYRKRALLIGAVVFVSYAYFYQGGGWNQNSRFDLVRAILEQRTLRIDAYQENTEDKSFAGGHYYSDKAPGLVLLAMPIAEAARPALRAAGVNPASPRGLVAMSYFATVFSVALPTSAACALLFVLALRLGANADAAAFGALAMGLATPIWAYATLFWGHALAGACLLLAFAVAVTLRGTRGRTGDLLRGLVVGLAAGWATVTEYPAAPASVILAVLAVTEVWPDGWRRRLNIAGSIAVGAVACVAVLMAYQYLAFGSPFRPSYSYYPQGAFPWMAQGYMGLTYPRPDVMLKILFSCRRGLLLVAPVVAAAPFGLRLLWKDKGTRHAAVAAASIAGYYFLFHASFSALPGWSYGPRYLGASLPLLCLGLAPAWSRAPLRWRRVLVALALYSAFLSLMAVSTTAQPPAVYKCPPLQLFWPSFWAGKLSLNRGSMLALAEEDTGHTHGAFNLGELAGLHGLASLIPLLVVWGIAAFFWIRTSGAAKPKPVSPPSLAG